MIVNETAKLENAPIPRLSSWAYPSSWSLSTSVVDVGGEARMPEPASSICDPLPPHREVRRYVARGIRDPGHGAVKLTSGAPGSYRTSQGRNRYRRNASCSIGKISNRVNPASSAYPRKVSGRITVPVAADGDAARPAGRQSKMLQP